MKRKLRKAKVVLKTHVSEERRQRAMIRLQEHLRRRRRTYVVFGGLWLCVSALTFGFNMDHEGAATGVVGTIIIVLADL